MRWGKLRREYGRSLKRIGLLVGIRIHSCRSRLYNTVFFFFLIDITEGKEQAITGINELIGIYAFETRAAYRVDKDGPFFARLSTRFVP